jgi:preprotein translocase subunit Sec63
MKKFFCVFLLIFYVCLSSIATPGSMNAWAEEEETGYNLPQGVHIDLDDDFYKELSNSQEGVKVHTTDSSRLYLQMILKNQKEIMRMLNLLLEQKTGKKLTDS